MPASAVEQARPGYRSVSGSYAYRVDLPGLRRTADTQKKAMIEETEKTVTIERAGGGDVAKPTIRPGVTAGEVVEAFVGSTEKYRLMTRDGLEFAPEDDLFEVVTEDDTLVTGAKPVVGGA